MGKKIRTEAIDFEDEKALFDWNNHWTIYLDFGHGSYRNCIKIPYGWINSFFCRCRLIYFLLLSIKSSGDIS